jgi:hypothetical protein
MNKTVVAMFAVGASVAVLAGVTTAQIGRLPIQPIEPVQASYQVRLVNEMGYPIRIKMVRYGSGRYLEEDLSRSGSVTRELYAGERVLCVWDRSQRLTLAAQVNVDRAGTLRLRPIAWPAAEAGPLGAARRSQAGQSADPLPRLNVEP